jgi:hypothetical protein
MLCSVPESALPSDVRGRMHVHFDEPADGSSPNQMRAAVHDAAYKVWSQIFELGPCPRGSSGPEYITSSDLMKLELPTSQDGYLEEDGEVLVNRAQPAEEQRPEFAAQVSFNIRQGIKYRYFFHRLEFGVLARLLYQVVTANPDENGKPKGEPLRREEVLSYLEMVEERLSINLVPSTGPIEFCVHHNVRTNQANCYLRYPFEAKFIPWSKNQDALHVAMGLKELGSEDFECDPLCVFRKTKQFDINDQNREKERDFLWTAIKRQFKDPDLHERLEKACFGKAIK